MANIPHSSRYRTSSNKVSANAAMADRAWSAHKSSNAHGRTADQPDSVSWLWGLAALGLLIAFPYHVLGAIGLVLVVAWYFGRN